MTEQIEWVACAERLPDDDEGREALAEYDAALALADQAMGSEG